MGLNRNLDSSAGGREVERRLARDVRRMQAYNRIIMRILGPVLKFNCLMCFMLVGCMSCVAMTQYETRETRHLRRSLNRSWKIFTLQGDPLEQVPASEPGPQLPDRDAQRIPPYQSPYESATAK